MRELPISDSQWIFDQSHLDHTPSRDDGISLHDELQRRKKCIEYIRSLALRAGAPIWTDYSTHPRTVMPVASTLVHRFYMRRSLRDFDVVLVAPTILFLASKIEEESLKLRFIVNSCLDKWEDGTGKWQADAHGNYGPQSLEYRRWEREILTTEELALEALCFNMAIEHPWVIFERSIRGLRILTDSEAQGKMGEAAFRHLVQWLCNSIVTSPLSILTHPDVLAFTMFVLALSARHKMPLSQSLAAAAERAASFNLDMQFNAETGAAGDDVAAVKLCLEQFKEYSQMGLIEDRVMERIPPERSGPPQYSRLFALEHAVNGKQDVEMSVAA